MLAPGTDVEIDRYRFGRGLLASVVVTRQDGDVYQLDVGGNLALQFVGTLSERNRTRLEHLHSTADLAGLATGAPAFSTTSGGDGAGARGAPSSSGRRCSQ